MRSINYRSTLHVTCAGAYGINLAGGMELSARATCPVYAAQIFLCGPVVRTLWRRAQGLRVEWRGGEQKTSEAGPCETTGETLFLNELAAKRLELLREMVPNVPLVASLVNPNNPGAQINIRELQAAACVGGQEILILNVSHEREFGLKLFGNACIWSGMS